MIKKVPNPADRGTTWEVACDRCGVSKTEYVPAGERVTWDQILGVFRPSEADAGHVCPDCRALEVLAVALYFT